MLRRSLGSYLLLWFFRPVVDHKSDPVGLFRWDRWTDRMGGAILSDCVLDNVHSVPVSVGFARHLTYCSPLVSSAHTLLFSGFTVLGTEQDVVQCGLTVTFSPYQSILAKKSRRFTKAPAEGDIYR